MSGAPRRAARSDAARNRERLLRSGRELFAARGLSTTLDDVAEHARVGSATAYRHFGSRQGLISAIFTDAARAFIDDAREGLLDPDPWKGLVGFVEAFATRQATDRGLHQTFADHHLGVLEKSDWDELMASMAALLARAQRAGAVSGEVEVADLVTLFTALGPLFNEQATDGEQSWRRHVGFFLRGITLVPHPRGR